MTAAGRAPQPAGRRWAQPLELRPAGDRMDARWVLFFRRNGWGRWIPEPGGILVNVSKGMVSPVFAGREAELAVMAPTFEAAAGRAPGTGQHGAAAGGGKSRLAEGFAARGAGRAAVVSVGRG